MQNRIQKNTKTILFIALGMQIIYMLSVVLITTMPQKLLILFGCSGNFDMPFDFYSFTYAAGCTKIWFFTALVLLMIAYSLYRFYGKTQKE